MTKEAFEKAVLAIVGRDKKHGWGQSDSLAMAAAIFEDETGEKADEKTVLPWFAEIINPSAFRQKLESAGVLEKQETKKQKHEKLFSGFTAKEETKTESK